jgi:RNA polymerase sigma-70 factor (ECF subfamily)
MDSPDSNHNLQSERLIGLIGRCTMQDRQAFVELYEASSAKLFSIALRILQRRAWAEEALQEAYLKIWRNAHRYNHTLGRPMTWMINIVRNQSLDQLRRSECRTAHDHETMEIEPESDANLQLDADTSDELRLLHQCMEGLKSDQRTSILMVYHQGYSAAEVSQMRGWPVGTVKTWVRRGLQVLRECMQ